MCVGAHQNEGIGRGNEFEQQRQATGCDARGGAECEREGRALCGGGCGGGGDSRRKQRELRAGEVNGWPLGAADEGAARIEVRWEPAAGTREGRVLSLREDEMEHLEHEVSKTGAGDLEAQMTRVLLRVWEAPTTRSASPDGRWSDDCVAVLCGKGAHGTNTQRSPTDACSRIDDGSSSSSLHGNDGQDARCCSLLATRDSTRAAAP